MTIERVHLAAPGEYTFVARQGIDPDKTVKINFVESAANNLAPASADGTSVTPTYGIVGTPFVVKAKGCPHGTISYEVSVVGKGIVKTGDFSAVFPFSETAYEVVVDTNLYGAGDYQVKYKNWDVEKVVHFTALPMPASP